MNHLYLITLIANFLTAVALITGGAFLGHVLTEVLNDPTL